MTEETKDMSFIDHLEELRWTLFRSAISVLVFAIIAFINKDFVFEKVLFGPTKPSFPTFKAMCLLSENGFSNGN